jgi:hypothetical protein
MIIAWRTYAMRLREGAIKSDEILSFQNYRKHDAESDRDSTLKRDCGCIKLVIHFKTILDPLTRTVSSNAILILNSSFVFTNPRTKRGEQRKKTKSESTIMPREKWYHYFYLP